MDPQEALLGAATYLKWFCDRTITPDVERPDAIGDIVVTLEQLASEELERRRVAEDLELAALVCWTSLPDD